MRSSSDSRRCEAIPLPPPPPLPRTSLRASTLTARPSPAAQVELRLTDHVLLGTREEAERMHAAEGADGDELRTTKYEIEQLEVRQRKQKKVLVKVAKMAVNAEGEHGAKLAEHDAALVISAELHASLVASAETLLAECAAARKKIREHHLLSVPTREVSRVEYLVPEGGDTEHWYLRETPAEARWEERRVRIVPTADRGAIDAREERMPTGADPIHGKEPTMSLGVMLCHDAQQPPIEVPLKTEEEKQRELETLRATHTVYMGANGATSVRVHPSAAKDGLRQSEGERREHTEVVDLSRFPVVLQVDIDGPSVARLHIGDVITRIGETPANTLRTSADIAAAIADQMMEVNDLQGGDEEEEAGRPRNKEVVELRIYRPYLYVSRSKADVLLERPKNESTKGRAQAFRSALGMGDGYKPSASDLSNTWARAT